MFISVEFSFFFSSRRRHTRYIGDWSSDVCSSDLDVDVTEAGGIDEKHQVRRGVHRGAEAALFFLCVQGVSDVFSDATITPESALAVDNGLPAGADVTHPAL